MSWAGPDCRNGSASEILWKWFSSNIMNSLANDESWVNWILYHDLDPYHTLNKSNISNHKANFFNIRSISIKIMGLVVEKMQISRILNIISVISRKPAFLSADRNQNISEKFDRIMLEQDLKACRMKYYMDCKSPEVNCKQKRPNSHKSRPLTGSWLHMVVGLGERWGGQRPYPIIQYKTSIMH